MTENETDAMPEIQTIHTPLLPKHPRLRFIDGAGDGAAGDSGDDGDEGGSGEGSGDDSGDADGTDALGDKGKQALDRMKEQRTAATKRATAAEKELADFKAAAALKDKPADEQVLEAAKAEARTEANTRANERILRADLRAAATGKLADPADAALYLNLADFAVSDDGETDSEALNDAITELLTRKPHLAAAKQTRFDGSADQGAKGKESKATQLSAQDIKGWSPSQIVEAQNAGRLDSILGRTK